MRWRERGLAPRGSPAEARGAHVPATKEAPRERTVRRAAIRRFGSAPLADGDGADDQGRGRLDTVRLANDAEILAREVGKAGSAAEVVVEATYGWYWAVDALQAAGVTVHLAHPLGVKGFAYR